MIVGVAHRDTFLLLRRQGVRVRRGPLTVTWADSGRPEIACAFAIPRAGGGAVARNRCRRRLKAILREEDAVGRVRPGAYLIGVAPEGVAAAYDSLHQHLVAALVALEDRRSSPGSRPGRLSGEKAPSRPDTARHRS